MTNLGFSQLVWQRTYGESDIEHGYSVKQTPDGGYIVAGITRSFGNNLQVYLIKTDSLGDTLWTKIYGGPGNDYGRCIQLTSDGGYIIAGYTSSFGDTMRVYLIKTDSLGDSLWTKNYGGQAHVYAYSIRQTNDGGYIITGGSPIYLIKTDSLGDTLWTKTFLGEGRSGQQTTDGGYIIVGKLNTDLYLLKTDSLGDTLWTRGYCWPRGWRAIGLSIQQTFDKGYIATGWVDYVVTPRVYQYVYLVKTDSLGDTLWTNVYGLPNHAYYGGYSVQQTQDSGYIIAGATSAFELLDMYLVKTDSLGNIFWDNHYGCYTGIDMGYTVQQTTDGGYIVVGYTDCGSNDEQVFLVKTDQDGNAGIEDTRQFWHLHPTPQSMVFPNPFSSFTTIIGYEKERFILFDVTGKRVNCYSGNRVGYGLPAGVYFLKSENLILDPIRIVKIE